MATRALEDLRKRAPANTDIFEKLTSVLSLLTITSSKQPSQNLSLSFQELFSKGIVELYETQPSLTLKLTSSIIADLFKFRLSPLLKVEKSMRNMNHIGPWEGLLRGILNGVQTYIDGENPDMGQIGNTLYKPLFVMLGSPSGLNLSARIRIQAYSLLADTAADCAGNRELLKQKTILGGSRLGGIIALTNEYLVLDSLFQILARLTPSSRDVTGRADLSKDVFQNAKAKKRFGKKTCDELAAILREAKGDQWEKTTDQFITTISRSDPLKPQPFRLLSNEIHASSVVYIHPQSLDRIYLDCSGFVANVQEKDGIDCLEVDYGSIASVQLHESLGGGIRTTLDVTLSLSSPPLIGLGPVSDPPKSDIRGHHVKFEISVEDLEGFKVALQARGMGALIHRGNSSYSKKSKSSILAGGPLDLNSVPVASLEEKSKEVETFYATSSSEEHMPLMRSKPKQILEPMSSTTLDEGMLASKITPDRNIAPITAKVQLMDVIGRRLHPNVDEERDMMTGKKKKLSATNRHAKLVLDAADSLTESESELESLDLAATALMSRHNETKPISGVALQKGVATTPGSTKTKKTDLDGKWEIFGSIIQSLSKPSKRRRESDDSTEETRKGKVARLQPLYDSQLLRPQETATTRSTTKYTTHRRKSSPLPYHSDTDFEALPPTPRVPVPFKSKSFPDTTIDMAPTEKNSIAAESGGIEAPIPAKCLRPSKPMTERKQRKKNTSTAMRRTRRPGRRVTIIESEDEIEGSATIVSAAPLDGLKDGTAMRSVAPLNGASLVTSKVGEKSKWNKAPWKNMVQQSSIADTEVCNKTTISDENAVVFYTHPDLDSRPGHLPNQIQPQTEMIQLLDFEVPLHASPGISPISLEPLDFNLAVAQGDMDIDLGAGSNPVVQLDSLSKTLPPATVSFEKVDSTHNIFKAGLSLRSSSPRTESKSIDKPKDASLKMVTGPKVAIPSPKPVRPLLTVSPKVPSPRYVEAIDLIYVNNEQSKECLQGAHLPIHSSTGKRGKKAGTPQRPTVTFAPHAKDSSGHTSHMGVETRPPNHKVKFHSLIPRLRVNRERERNIMETAKMRKSSRLQPKPQFLEIPRRPPQSTRLQLADYESEDDEEEREINADQKILMVLNQIQEVILGNMNKKFNGTTMHTRAVMAELRLCAAEDIKEIRDKSGEHLKNLVQLEEKYAKYGREMRSGFEELNKMNVDTNKRLRQAVLDHDKHGLSKKMPSKLASRPKIFLSLAAA